MADDYALWQGRLPQFNLDNNGQTDSIHWSGRKRIFLEGKTDYDIITKYWFTSDDVIEFYHDKTNSGGCKWVIEQVREHPDTFGIIDRDVLLCNDFLHIFFETDDIKYLNSNPIHSNILIFTHYEIENFLFDISSIYKIITLREKKLYNETNVE